MLLASICFGVGVGMALVFPPVLFLLRPAAWTRRVQVASFALPLATVALYFGLRRLYAYITPLSLEEALQLAFARASLVGAPAVLGQLLGFSVAASVRGFAMAPATYPDAASVAAIAAFASGVALTLAYGEPDLRRALARWGRARDIWRHRCRARKRRRRLAVSSWTAAQPHFHYAGTIPIVVLLCLMTEQVAETLTPRCFGAGARARRGNHRRGARVRAFGVCDRRPPGCAELRGHHLGGDLRGRRRAPARNDGLNPHNGVLPGSVRGPMLGQAVLPGRAALFVLVAPSGDLDGRRVRFIEPDPKVLLDGDRAPKLGAPRGPLPSEATPPGPAVAPER